MSRSSSNSAGENLRELASEPLAGLLVRYSWPALVAMTLNALYSVVDRVFIGQGCGVDAMAGLQLAMPVMMLFGAFGVFVGAGHSAILSIKLGEGDRTACEKILGQLVAVKLLFFCLLPPLVFFNLDTVLGWCGADRVTPGAFAAAREYLKLVVFSHLFSHLAFGLSAMQRAEGSAIRSMLCMVVGFGANLALDPLLIFGCDFTLLSVHVAVPGRGVAGAAWATNIAMFLSCFWAIGYYWRRQTVVPLHLRRIWLYPKLLWRASAVGLAPFLQQLMSSIIVAALAIAFSRWMPDEPSRTARIASLGVFSGALILVFTPVLGCQQGLQPIFGFNWGARNYGRVRKALSTGLWVTFLLTVLSFVVQVVPPFPEWIAMMFVSSDDPALVSLCAGDLAVANCMVWCISLNVVATTFFQSIGRPAYALVLSMLRQGIVLLPVVFILPHFMEDKALAIWLSMPISDVLCNLATIPPLVSFLRFMGKFPPSRSLVVASLLLGAQAFADTVWLDEPGVWDRMSGGHGKSWVSTNGWKTAAGTLKHGVGTCAPSALYLAMDGNAISFEATISQLYGPNKSKLKARVYRERELAFESPVLDRESGAIAVKADLKGARWVKIELFGIEAPYSGTTLWGDAKFEMKRGTRPADIATMTRQLGILTPPTPPEPRLHAPARFGARPQSEFFFHVPVTGERPMKVSVAGLGVPGLEDVAFDAERQVLSGRASRRGEFPLTFTAANSRGTAVGKMTLVVGDKLALTPALGWNSWNAFAWKVTGDIVRRTADRMRELGLTEHGWAYLTIDDGWQLSARKFKPEERRDANGGVKSNELFADMKELADYVHVRGLKIGLYSSPGPTTCANYEGSWMHEFEDAKTYAEWGYDYLKHDWCSYGSKAFGENKTAQSQYPYVLMSQALRASGRDIIHSICQYGSCNVAEWGADVGGQCWRTTGDKFDFWEDVFSAMKTHENLWRYVRPGGWNDADMMLVGKTFWSDHRGTRLTPNEQYTHVSMWAMFASTMMIGCDLDGIDDFTLSLLTNDEVLSVNQDELGKAAAPVDADGDFQYWARPLADGSIAVALVNLSPEEHEGTFCFVRNGLEGRWLVRDLWRQRDEGERSGCYKAFVPGHATKLITLKPIDDARLAPGLADIRDNFYLRRIEKYRPIRPTAAASGSSDASCGSCSR